MQPARIEYASCPLCGNAAIVDLLEADCTRHVLYQPALPATIGWCRCHRCAHVFAEGYFNPAAQALLFAATPPEQEPGYDVERQRALWAEVVERVAAYGGSTHGRWLDVGFGNGSLVFTAAEWGYRPLGIDLRAGSVAKLQALGYEARCCDILELEENEAFQVVSLADVIEHLPFPRKAIEHAADLLLPGGLLFVSTPNMDTAVWRALDAQQANPYWGELEHFHCFSRARLYALLAECDFEPLHYSVSPRYRCGMDVIARKC
jgi:protein O-GlcNAc transferase